MTAHNSRPRTRPASTFARLFSPIAGFLLSVAACGTSDDNDGEVAQAGTTGGGTPSHTAGADASSTASSSEQGASNQTSAGPSSGGVTAGPATNGSTDSQETGTTAAGAGPESSTGGGAGGAGTDGTNMGGAGGDASATTSNVCEPWPTTRACFDPETLAAGGSSGGTPCPPPLYQDSVSRGCIDPIQTSGELEGGMCCWTCRLVCG